MNNKRTCSKCLTVMPVNSEECPNCSHVPGSFKDEDLLKKRVEKVFRDRGYKTKRDHRLKSDSGKKYEIDVYAEYEAELHKDKLVIDCKLHRSPLDTDLILEIDEILQDTHANKGILACPSGFTSEAKESAARKGIELLDGSTLLQLGVLKTDVDFIERKKNNIEVDIYYSLIDECKKKELFSLTYPDRPTRKAIKKGFKKNDHPLTEKAIITRISRKKTAVADINIVYFIEYDIDEQYELKVYTYQGIDLDDDIEIKLKYQIVNRGNRTIEDLCVEGEVSSSEDKTLNEVYCYLDPDSDLYDSKSYSDSKFLFSLDTSGYDEDIEEGKISGELKKAFEKKGFGVEEDAELFEESGRWWIREDEVTKYLIKRDDKETKIYDSYSEKTMEELHPGDVIDYIVQVSLPFRLFIRHYDNLGLKLRLIERGKKVESVYYDMSSSKDFKKEFSKDLKDLEKSLSSEARKNNASQHKNRPGCFIATAVYGDPRAEKIDHLRSFRDEVLLNKKGGELFTDVYYKLSPPIADYISKNQSTKKMVGYLIVYPLTKIAEDVLDSE
ncbi:MAG: restriction endonuclease [Candidatus Saliniplasma sp.]